MIQDILSDPLKMTMAIILVVLEVPAAIALVIMWRKACQEKKVNEEQKEEQK